MLGTRLAFVSKSGGGSLFIWLVDVSIGNAYYLYKRSPDYNDELPDLLGFKGEAVQVYGQRYKPRLVLLDQGEECHAKGLEMKSDMMAG